MVSLAERRRGAEHLQRAVGLSERRACRLVDVSRSTKRRAPGCFQKTALIAEIHNLSNRYPRFGYRKVFDRLKEAGWHVGRERVRLLRRTEGLKVPRKSPKRRRPGTSTIDLEQAEFPNHVWSYDFVADQTYDGRSIRFLTVIDEFTREALWIECARHLTSVDVVRVLEQLVELHNPPVAIKSDNGAEFVSKRVQEWIKERGIGARFIKPGSPWQNGHCESFNGVFRDGCLNRWIFESLREAREATEAWLSEYNQERPHGSLGGQTPFRFIEKWNQGTRETA